MDILTSRLRDFATTVRGQFDQVKARLAALETGGGGGGGGAWGSITGTLSAQTDLQGALDAKQAVGSYLTGNQSITLSGDAAGAGATAIAVTLSAVNASPGTFGDATHSLTATVDAKGRVTALASQLVAPAFASLTGKPTTVAGYGITDALTTNQTITLSGDASGSGSTAITVTIGANKITRAMLAQAAGATILGATTAGNVADLTAAQAKTVLAITAGDVSGLGYFATGTDAANLTGTVAGARLATAVPTSGSFLVTGLVDASSTIVSRNGAIQSDATAGNAAFFRMSQAGTIKAYVALGGDGKTVFWNADDVAGSHIFEVNGATKMTLTTAGNLVVTGTVGGSNLSGTNTGDQTITLTGDVTGGGTGSFAGTLATVNANIGSFGSASQVPTFTVNGKGLTTAAANVSIQIAESQVTNLTTDLAAKAPLASPQFTGVSYYQQPAPTAMSASATLTIAQMLTLIITATSTTAVSLTLPTGTLTDAGILSGALAVNEAFEWYVINLGSSSGAVTMVAGTGQTIVGSATVAIATSARFLTRKTATNTFVTYRIA